MIPLDNESRTQVEEQKGVVEYESRPKRTFGKSKSILSDQYQLPSSTILTYQTTTEISKGTGVTYQARYNTENSHLDMIFDFSGADLETLKPKKIMKSWKKGFEDKTMADLVTDVKQQYATVNESLSRQGANIEEINEIFTNDYLPTSTITFRGISEEDAKLLGGLLGGRITDLSGKKPDQIIRGAGWKDYVGPLTAGPVMALVAGLSGLAVFAGAEVTQYVSEKLDGVEAAVEPAVAYARKLVENSEVAGGLRVVGSHIGTAVTGLVDTLKEDGYLDRLIEVGENISSYTTQIRDAAAAAYTNLSDAATELNETLLAEGGLIDTMQGYLDSARTNIDDLKTSLTEIKQDLTNTYNNIQLEIDKIDGEMNNISMTYRFDNNPANDITLSASSDGNGADILYDGDGNPISYKLNDGSYWNIGDPDPPQFSDGVQAEDFAQKGLVYHYNVTVMNSTNAHALRITDAMNEITRDQYGGLADAKSGLEATQASVLSISGKTDDAINLADSAYVNVVAAGGDGTPENQGVLGATRDSITNASEDVAAAQGSLDEIISYANNIDTEVTSLNTYVGDIRTDLDKVNAELGAANTELYGDGTPEKPGLIAEGESAIATYDNARETPKMSGLAKAYNSIPGPVKKIGAGAAVGIAGVATVLRFFSPKTILKKNARRDMILPKGDVYRNFEGPLMQAPEIVYQVS